ncbi:sigma-70 family RNA polymerase sigma factor [Candidatus Poribacteria bacterium]|nr:sigma-70 family RNA polymerase sigma factor [Candidatus Poribacteria bacterium]
MLEQQKLGFDKEEEFIYAVQKAMQVQNRSQLDDDILEAFCKDYEKYIKNVARKRGQDHLSQDMQKDLNQHIWAHVLKKICKWKYKGFKFTTWLHSVSYNAATDWWREHGLIRIPHSIYSKVKAYKKALEDLSMQSINRPMDEEIAAKLGWSLEDVRKTSIINLTSTNIAIGNDKDNDIQDIIPDPNIPESPYDNDILQECISQLNDNERNAIVLFFKEGCPQAEIASMMGVSRSTISTWVSRAKKDLKKCLKDKGIFVR